MRTPGIWYAYHTELRIDELNCTMKDKRGGMVMIMIMLDKKQGQIPYSSEWDGPRLASKYCATTITHVCMSS